jgi:hypothetical protein
MFWDPDDSMKRAFFEQVPERLAPRGRVYFGWADFSDLDANLPVRLAKAAGLRLARVFRRPSRSGRYQFMVLEFVGGRGRLRSVPALAAAVNDRNGGSVGRLCRQK